MDNHNWVQQWADRKYSRPHVFGDVVEQVPAQRISKSLAFRPRREQVETLPLLEKQWCFTHGTYCQNGVARVDVDFSGLPCQDMNTANVNRQFFEGPNGTCYIVWARRHRIQRTPLLILENVRDTWSFIIFIYIPLCFVICETHISETSDSRLPRKTAQTMPPFET